MDQFSVIKWTIMEKAKFGQHSLNAEKKTFLQQHGLVLRIAAAGGQIVQCHLMEAGKAICSD